MENKKVLALNFGRVNGNCKKLLTEAVKTAEAAGAEVTMIDTMKLEIKPCIGCGACSRVLQSGKGQISCCQKDDYEALSDAVLAADAIIVAAPVYVLAPTGQFKNFIDRFGPAHDKAYMLFENELGMLKASSGILHISGRCDDTALGCIWDPGDESVWHESEYESC